MACPRETGQYGDAMAAAQEFARRPACDCVDGDHITNSRAYHAAIVEYLSTHGYCALFDGEEIAVKRVNAFSEQWDMERANATVLRAYQATCRPAWSAIPPSGGPAPSPTPSPAPTPSPSPCVPQTVTGPCFAPPEPGCTTCRDRLLWDLTHGDGAAKRARIAAAKAKKAGKKAIPPPSKPRGPIPHGAKGFNSCPPDCHLYELPNSGEKFRDQLLYNDPGGNPARRECFNWQCQKVDCRTRAVLNPSGWFGPVCEDKVEIPCPVAAPCPSPTPGPTPPPTGDQCPWLECIGTHVQSVVCNGQSVPISQLHAGCNVNLDATAYFGGCGPNYRCDGECDLQTSRNDCCNGLRTLCEDPRGPEWVQLAGPSTPCRQGSRSWGCGLDSVRSGTYRFMPCGNGWTDRRGVPNANQGPACDGQDPRTVVTFVVP